MPVLQDWVHHIATGSGLRYLRISLGILALAALVFCYDWLCWRNLAAPEAMDAAQVARNLSEGKGYTTLFVRPLSLHLVKERNLARWGVLRTDNRPDYSEIKGMHPDLANPPVYPVVLAGLMKVLPFRYTLDFTQSFWNSGGQFWRYEPDFLITLFNQLLLLIVIGLTFWLARALFDPGVAWLSALLLLGCELLWRFSASGLSTLLLLVIFLGLAWCLVLIERQAREPRWGPASLWWLAAAAGVLVGIGTLTRYAFGWVLVPVLVFLILFSGPRRAALALLALGAFAVVLLPWVYRNWSVGGMPFGTATFALVEGTPSFPGDHLQRSLHPNFNTLLLSPFIHKLLNNTRDILHDQLPRLGSPWVAPFFLVGLMVGFRSPALRRLRYFVMMCLGTLGLAQALGKTCLSDTTAEINSENLLVLLVPFVVMYGVSLFFVLLDQINLTYLRLRQLLIAFYAALVWLPMLYAFLPPRPLPIVYPPYYPPEIQQTSGWMRENELIMSDIPWAVAWYGRRQCVWLTLDARAEFFNIYDYEKEVRALYLTRATLDRCVLSDWLRADETSWENFLLNVTTRKGLRPDFPLRYAQQLRDDIFLADTPRWTKPQ